MDVQTLKMIELDKNLSKDNTNDMFKDGDNNYVAYPSMEQLSIELNSSEATDTLPLLFPGGALLPYLQQFNCPYAYPFGGDVVFKGNQQTLKCLDLKMDPETVEILIHNNVISSTSHSNLKQVAIRMDYVKFDNRDKEDYAKLVYEIGKNALDLKLDIPCYQYLKPLYFNQSRILGQHGLQRLSFESYPLNIDETITIAKELPNLVKLTTSISTSETLATDI